MYLISVMYLHSCSDGCLASPACAAFYIYGFIYCVKGKKEKKVLISIQDLHCLFFLPSRHFIFCWINSDVLQCRFCHRLHAVSINIEDYTEQEQNYLPWVSQWPLAQAIYNWCKKSIYNATKILSNSPKIYFTLKKKFFK